MLTTGQITPDSPFGQALTKYAKQSQRILEIGFGSGLGSSLCLLDGMLWSDRQSITFVEADPQQFSIGVENIERARKGRPHIIYRSGVLHKMVRPYWHPVGSVEHRDEWQRCFDTSRSGQLITDVVTDRTWDLVVLDGGEYSTDGDFLLLWPTTKVFALDDLNPALATKNVYAANCLRLAGWNLLEDGINDRNGWQIWGRP